jgi:hypothetical protein
VRSSAAGKKDIKEKLVMAKFVVARTHSFAYLRCAMESCHLLLRTGICVAAATVMLLAASGGTPSGSPSPDKSGYTLFNPTPHELMREMATDRPDKTESPYTVDAGHAQVEMDLASFAYDRHNVDRTDERVEAWSLASMNLKVGLLNNVDLQLLFETWNTVRTVEKPGYVRSRADGFGDMTLRMKINVWGNDGGRTALALMPFVKIPTNQDDLGNDAFEGGLIVPFAVELPGGWGMGLMTEVDILEDADADGFHAEWINTITFSRDLTEKFGVYVEFFSAITSERHMPWVGTFDVGVTYAISDDIQLDAGVNIGLTRSADDVNPFVGLSWRF